MMKSYGDDPATTAFAITPHDVDLFPNITRFIYVGVTGDIHVEMAGGGDVIFKGVLAGTTLRVRAKRIFAAGTTATNLIALY